MGRWVRRIVRPNAQKSTAVCAPRRHSDTHHRQAAVCSARKLLATGSSQALGTDTGGCCSSVNASHLAPSTRSAPLVDLAFAAPQRSRVVQSLGSAEDSFPTVSGFPTPSHRNLPRSLSRPPGVRPEGSPGVLRLAATEIDEVPHATCLATRLKRPISGAPQQAHLRPRCTPRHCRQPPQHPCCHSTSCKLGQ